MKRKSFKFLSLLSPIVLVVFCMLVGVSFLTTKNTPVLANQIPNMATSQTDQTENLEQTTQSEFETWVNFVMSEKSGVGGDGTVFAQNANKDLKISGNVINVYSEVGLAIISAHSNGLFSDGITSSISNITIDSNLTDTTFSGYTISLEADLNLYGKYWTPIGTSENKFAGKFIGNGHKISGVMIDSLISGDAKALFGYCDSTAVIADLLVTDCIGAESGIAYSGETGAIITGCYTDCYNICGTDDSNNNISIDNLNNAWKNIDSAIGVNSHYVEWYLDDEKLQGEVTLGTPTIEGNVHTVEFTSSSVMLTDVTIASITFELFDYTSYSASTGTFSRELSSITKELTVDNQEESYNYQKESYNQYRLTFNEGQGSRGGIADFNPSISTDPSSSTNKNTFKTTFSTTHQTALKVTITLAYRQVDAPSLSYYTLNESKITAEYQQLNGSYFYDDEYLNKLNTGTYVVGIWQKNTSVPEGKFTYANTAQGTGGVYRIKDKINITNASGYSAYVNVTTDSEKFLSNGSSLDSNSYVEINSSGQEINISIVNIFSVTLNNGNISFNGTKFETDTKSPNVIAYVIDTGLNGTREGKDTPLFIYNDYSGVPNIKKTTLVVTSSSSSTFGSADNTLEAVTTFEKDETYDCYWGMNTINYTLICNGGIIAYALVNPYANSGNGAIVDGVTINNGDNSIPFSFVLVAYYTGVVYQYINVTATNCGNDIINRSALVNVGGTYKSVGENILYYDSVIDALIGVNNRYVEISALTDNREKEEKYEFTLNNITATIKIIDKTANIYGTASGLGTNIIFNNIEYLVSDFTVSTDAEGKRQGEYSITYKFDKNIIDINCGDLTLVDFSINGLIVDEVIPTNGTSIMTNYIDSDVNDYRKKWTLSKFLSLNMKIEFTINGEEFTTTSDKIQIKLDPTQTTMDYVDAGFVSQERNVFHYTYSSKYGFPYYIYYSKHKWETDSTICYFSNNGESEGISETNFIPGKVEKDNAIKSTNGIFKIYYETKVVQVDGELPLYVLDLSIVFLQNYTGSKLTFKVDFVAVNFDYNINFEQQGDYKQGDYNYIDEYDESLNISYSQYTSKNLYVSFNDSTSYAKYVNLYSGRNESTYFADSDTYTTGGSLFFDGRLKSTTVENNKAVEIKYEYIAVKKLVSSSYKYDHKLTYSIIVYKDNLTTALNTIKIRGVSSNYINYVFNGNQRLTYDVRSICSVEIENQALKLNLINTDSILTYYYVYKYKPTTGYAIGDFDFFGNTSETTGNVEFRYQDYAGTSKTGYVTFKPIEITANVSYGYDNNGSVSEINSELLTDKNAVVSTGAFNVENDLILKAPEIDYHTFGYIDSHIFGYYAIKDSNENSNGNYYKLCDESGNVFTSNSDNLSISAELLYCLDSAGNRLKVDLVNNLVTVVATKENSDYSVGDIVNITLNNGGVNIVVVYTANSYKFTVDSFDNNGNVISYGIEKSYTYYTANTNISGELSQLDGYDFVGYKIDGANDYFATSTEEKDSATFRDALKTLENPKKDNSYVIIAVYKPQTIKVNFKVNGEDAIREDWTIEHTFGSEFSLTEEQLNKMNSDLGVYSITKISNNEYGYISYDNGTFKPITFSSYAESYEFTVYVTANEKTVIFDYSHISGGKTVEGKVVFGTKEYIGVPKITAPTGFEFLYWKTEVIVDSKTEQYFIYINEDGTVNSNSTEYKIDDKYLMEDKDGDGEAETIVPLTFYAYFGIKQNDIQDIVDSWDLQASFFKDSGWGAYETLTESNNIYSFVYNGNHTAVVINTNYANYTDYIKNDTESLKNYGLDNKELDVSTSNFSPLYFREKNLLYQLYANVDESFNYKLEYTIEIDEAKPYFLFIKNDGTNNADYVDSCTVTKNLALTIQQKELQLTKNGNVAESLTKTYDTTNTFDITGYDIGIVGNDYELVDIIATDGDVGTKNIAYIVKYYAWDEKGNHIKDADGNILYNYYYICANDENIIKSFADLGYSATYMNSYTVFNNNNYNTEKLLFTAEITPINWNIKLTDSNEVPQANPIVVASINYSNGNFNVISGLLIGATWDENNTWTGGTVSQFEDKRVYISGDELNDLKSLFAGFTSVKFNIVTSSGDMGTYSLSNSTLLITDFEVVKNGATYSLEGFNITIDDFTIGLEEGKNQFFVSALNDTNNSYFELSATGATFADNKLNIVQEDGNVSFTVNGIGNYFIKQLTINGQELTEEEINANVSIDYTTGDITIKGIDLIDGVLIYNIDIVLTNLTLVIYNYGFEIDGKYFDYEIVEHDSGASGVSLPEVNNLQNYGIWLYEDGTRAFTSNNDEEKVNATKYKTIVVVYASWYFSSSDIVFKSDRESDNIEIIETIPTLSRSYNTITSTISAYIGNDKLNNLSWWLPTDYTCTLNDNGDLELKNASNSGEYHLMDATLKRNYSYVNIANLNVDDVRINSETLELTLIEKEREFKPISLYEQFNVDIKPLSLALSDDESKFSTKVINKVFDGKYESYYTITENDVKWFVNEHYSDIYDLIINEIVGKKILLRYDSLIQERILGRVCARDITTGYGGTTIIKAGEVFTQEIVNKLETNSRYSDKIWIIDDDGNECKICCGDAGSILEYCFLGDSFYFESYINNTNNYNNFAIPNYIFPLNNSDLIIDDEDKDTIIVSGEILKRDVFVEINDGASASHTGSNIEFGKGYFTAKDYNNNNISLTYSSEKELSKVKLDDSNIYLTIAYFTTSGANVGIYSNESINGKVGTLTPNFVFTIETIDVSHNINLITSGSFNITNSRLDLTINDKITKTYNTSKQEVTLEDLISSAEIDKYGLSDANLSITYANNDAFTGETNVGTYNLKVLITKENYTDFSADIVFTIEKLNVSVNALSAYSKNYDGTVDAGFIYGTHYTLSFSGETKGEVVLEDYQIKEIISKLTFAFNDKNAGGSKTITPSSSDENINYVTGTLTGEIEKLDITITVSDSEFIYSGLTTYNFDYSLITVVTLVNGEKVASGNLVLTTDSALAVGTYNLSGYSLDKLSFDSVKLVGGESITTNYEIKGVSGEFEVTKATVAISLTNSYTYTGQKVALEYTATSGGKDAKRLIGSATITQKVGGDANAISVGTYTATFTLNSGNFKLEQSSFDFEITKKAVTLNINATKAYDKTVFVYNVTNTDSRDLCSGHSFDGSTITTNNFIAKEGGYQIPTDTTNVIKIVDAGKNDVTANYEITLTGALTISKVLAEITAVSVGGKTSSSVYTGAEQTLKITVTYKYKANGETVKKADGSDFVETFTYSSNDMAEYYAWVKLEENKGKTYLSYAQETGNPLLIVKFNNGISEAGTKVLYAGEYVIEMYDVSIANTDHKASTSFTITPKVLNVSDFEFNDEKNYNKVYDGTNEINKTITNSGVCANDIDYVKFSAVYDGLFDVCDITYTINTSNVDATVNLTATDLKNIKDSYTLNDAKGSGTISAREVVFTYSGTSDLFYNGNALEINISNFDLTDKGSSEFALNLNESFSGNVLFENIKNAGEYDLSKQTATFVASGDNKFEVTSNLGYYSITFAGSITINKAIVSVGQVKNNSHTYDAQKHTATLIASIVSGGFDAGCASGENVLTATYKNETTNEVYSIDGATNAGTYLIYPQIASAFANNYQLADSYYEGGNVKALGTKLIISKKAVTITVNERIHAGKLAYLTCFEYNHSTSEGFASGATFNAIFKTSKTTGGVTNISKESGTYFSGNESGNTITISNEILTGGIIENYDISYNVTLTIDEELADNEIVIKDYEIEYAGKEFVLSDLNLEIETELTGEFAPTLISMSVYSSADLSETATLRNAGEYYVTFKYESNNETYEYNYPVKVVIKQKYISLKIEDSGEIKSLPTTKVYDGVVARYLYTGDICTDDLSKLTYFSLNYDSIFVGETFATPSLVFSDANLSKNYTFTENVTITIIEKELTVTLSNLKYLFDQNGEYVVDLKNVSIDGFLEAGASFDESTIKIKKDGICSGVNIAENQSIVVSTIKVMAGGNDYTANYKFNFAGSLTIKPIRVNVEFNPLSGNKVTYNASSVNIDYTISAGFESGLYGYNGLSINEATYSNLFEENRTFVEDALVQSYAKKTGANVETSVNSAVDSGDYVTRVSVRSGKNEIEVLTNSYTFTIEKISYQLTTADLPDVNQSIYGIEKGFGVFVNGDMPKFEIKKQFVLTGKTIDVSITFNSSALDTNTIGTYDLTLKSYDNENNFEISITNDKFENAFAVVDFNAGVNVVIENNNLVFNGQNQSPTIKLYEKTASGVELIADENINSYTLTVDGEEVLKDSSTFNFARKDVCNITVAYEIVVTGLDGLDHTVTGEFKFVISALKVTITNVENIEKTYDSLTAVSFEKTFTLSNGSITTEVENELNDLEFEFENENVGERLSVSLKNQSSYTNYDFTYDLSGTIKQKDITLTVAGEKYYDGQKAKVVANVLGYVLDAHNQIEIEFEEVNAGEYTTFTGVTYAKEDWLSNYNVTAISGTYEIKQAVAMIEAINGSGKTFDGKGHRATFVAKIKVDQNGQTYGALVNNANTLLACKYYIYQAGVKTYVDIPVNAGTYYLEISTLNDNYVFEYEKVEGTDNDVEYEFTIIKKDYAIVMDKTVSYSAQYTNIGYYYTDLTNGNTSNVTEIENHSLAGQVRTTAYQAGETYKLSDNSIIIYNLSINGVKVYENGLLIEDSLALNNYNITYDLTIEVSEEGANLQDGEVVASANDLTYAGQGNDQTSQITITLTYKDKTETITSANAEFVGVYKVDANFDFASANVASMQTSQVVNVGEYYVYVNVEGLENPWVKVVLNQKEITSFEDFDGNKVYDGNNSIVITSSDVYNLEVELTATYESANADAKLINISLNGTQNIKANYILSESLVESLKATGKILKREIKLQLSSEIEFVYAGEVTQTIEYSKMNICSNYSLVGGQTLSGEIKITVSNIGDYDLVNTSGIEIVDGSNNKYTNNYEISFEEGTKVTVKQLEVNVNLNGELNYTSNDLINDFINSAVVSESKFSQDVIAELKNNALEFKLGETSVSEIVNAGEYTVALKASYENGSNFKITITSGDLKVNKASATVNFEKQVSASEFALNSGYDLELADVNGLFESDKAMFTSKATVLSGIEVVTGGIYTLKTTKDANESEPYVTDELQVVVNDEILANYEFDIIAKITIVAGNMVEVSNPTYQGKDVDLYDQIVVTVDGKTLTASEKQKVDSRKITFVKETYQIKVMVATGVWQVVGVRVLPKPIDFNNITYTAEKEYDGNTNVLSVVCSDIVSGDSVTISGSYESKNVGANIAISFVINGEHSSNYDTSNLAKGQGAITAKKITLTLSETPEFVYDISNTYEYEYKNSITLCSSDSFKTGLTLKLTFTYENVGTDVDVSNITTNNFVIFDENDEDVTNCYEFAYSGKINITARPFVANVEAGENLIYDTKEKEVVVTVESKEGYSLYSSETASILNKVKVTYYKNEVKEENKLTAKPVDAGTYVAVVSYQTDNYVLSEESVTQVTFVVEQYTLTISQKDTFEYSEDDISSVSSFEKIYVIEELNISVNVAYERVIGDTNEIGYHNLAFKQVNNSNVKVRFDLSNEDYIENDNIIINALKITPSSNKTLVITLSAYKNGTFARYFGRKDAGVFNLSDFTFTAKLSGASDDLTQAELDLIALEGTVTFASGDVGSYNLFSNTVKCGGDLKYSSIEIATTLQLQILARPILITSDSYDKVFDGTDEFINEFSLSAELDENDENDEFDSSYSMPVVSIKYASANAGENNLIITLKNTNYTLSANNQTKGTINPLEVDITPVKQEFVYGEITFDQNLTLLTSLFTLTSKDGKDLSNFASEVLVTVKAGENVVSNANLSTSNALKVGSYVVNFTSSNLKIADDAKTVNIAIAKKDIMLNLVNAIKEVVEISKLQDGTTNIAVESGYELILTGLIENDIVTFANTPVYENNQPAKQIKIVYAISGADANNYQTLDVTGEIIECAVNVTFDYNYNNLVSGDLITTITSAKLNYYNEVTSLPIPSHKDKGYTFKGWSSGLTLDEQNVDASKIIFAYDGNNIAGGKLCDLITPYASDVTLYAVWEVNSFEVNVERYVYNFATKEYVKDSDFTFEKISKDYSSDFDFENLTTFVGNNNEYHYIGYKVNGSSINSDVTTLKVTQNVTVSLMFMLNEYQVSFTLTEGEFKNVTNKHFSYSVDKKVATVTLYYGEKISEIDTDVNYIKKGLEVVITGKTLTRWTYDDDVTGLQTFDFDTFACFKAVNFESEIENNTYKVIVYANEGLSSGGQFNLTAEQLTVWSYGKQAGGSLEDRTFIEFEAEYGVDKMPLIPTPVKSGYTFEKLTCSNAEFKLNAGDVFNYASDVYMYATYTENLYTLTINTENISKVDVKINSISVQVKQEYEVKTNDKVEISVVVKYGYELSGDSAITATGVITKDVANKKAIVNGFTKDLTITFTATAKTNMANIEIVGGNGIVNNKTNTTSDTMFVKTGNTLEFTITPNLGYSFGNVYAKNGGIATNKYTFTQTKDANGTITIKVSGIEENCEIYVNLLADSVSVRFNYENAIVTINEAEIYSGYIVSTQVGQQIKFKVSANYGFEIVSAKFVSDLNGISDFDVEYSNSTQEYTLKGFVCSGVVEIVVKKANFNVTISYAEYDDELDQIITVGYGNIKATPLLGGEAKEYSTYEIEYLSKITISANVIVSGYKVYGFYIDDITGNLTRFDVNNLSATFEISKDATIYVVVERQEYTVKFIANENGSLTANSQTGLETYECKVRYGRSTTEIEAVANNYFDFAGWFINGQEEVYSSNSKLTVSNVVSDMEFVATFAGQATKLIITININTARTDLIDYAILQNILEDMYKEKATVNASEGKIIIVFNDDAFTSGESLTLKLNLPAYLTLVEDETYVIANADGKVENNIVIQKIIPTEQSNGVNIMNVSVGAGVKNLTVSFNSKNFDKIEDISITLKSGNYYVSTKANINQEEFANLVVEYGSNITFILELEDGYVINLNNITYTYGDENLNKPTLVVDNTLVNNFALNSIESDMIISMPIEIIKYEVEVSYVYSNAYTENKGTYYIEYGGEKLLDENGNALILTEGTVFESEENGFTYEFSHFNTIASATGDKYYIDAQGRIYQKDASGQIVTNDEGNPIYGLFLNNNGSASSGAVVTKLYGIWYNSVKEVEFNIIPNVLEFNSDVYNYISNNGVSYIQNVAKNKVKVAVGATIEFVFPSFSGYSALAYKDSLSGELINATNGRFSYKVNYINADTKVISIDLIYAFTVLSEVKEDVNSNGANTAFINDETSTKIYIGQEVTLKATRAVGYNFVGWKIYASETDANPIVIGSDYASVSCVENIYTVKYTCEGYAVKIVAEFEAKQITPTTNLNEFAKANISSVEFNQQKYKIGETILININGITAGYELKDILVNGSKINATKLSEETNLDKTYAIYSYVVTAQDAEKGQFVVDIILDSKEITVMFEVNIDSAGEAKINNETIYKNVASGLYNKIYKYNADLTFENIVNQKYGIKSIKINGNEVKNLALDSFTISLTTQFGFNVTGQNVISYEFEKLYWANIGEFNSFSGSGTESDPYIIGSEKDLAYLAYLVNKGNNPAFAYYKVTANIDLQERFWEPIGTELNPFKGVFNLGTKQIENLELDPDKEYKVLSWKEKVYGLFGYIAQGSKLIVKVSYTKIIILISAFALFVIGMIVVFIVVKNKRKKKLQRLAVASNDDEFLKVVNINNENIKEEQKLPEEKFGDKKQINSDYNNQDLKVETQHPEFSQEEINQSIDSIIADANKKTTPRKKPATQTKKSEEGLNKKVEQSEKKSVPAKKAPAKKSLTQQNAPKAENNVPKVPAKKPATPKTKIPPKKG